MAGNFRPDTPTMLNFPTLPRRRKSNMVNPTTPTFLSEPEAPPPTKPVVYSPVPTCCRKLSPFILWRKTYHENTWRSHFDTADLLLNSQLNGRILQKYKNKRRRKKDQLINVYMTRRDILELSIADGTRHQATYGGPDCMDGKYTTDSLDSLFLIGCLVYEGI
jgi:hypothetical protein